MSKQEVWAQLIATDVVHGEMADSGAVESPWYIKVLLGFSGWVAAIFLMAFIALGAKIFLDSATAALVIGCLMVGVAYTTLRLAKNEFLEQLAFAISLAGQAWIIFSFFEFSDKNFPRLWIMTGTLQVVLAALMPNFLHRVFSTCGAAVAFSIALVQLNIPYLLNSVLMLIAAWLWLNEFRYPQQIKKNQAIAYGLVLALIPLKGTMIFGYDLLDWSGNINRVEPWIKPWMGEVLTGLVTLYVVWQLLQRHYPSLLHRVPLALLVATFLLCIAALEARGITCGIIILMLGFSASNRVLMGLGIVSLLFYISAYYYLLDTTLLNKSISLLAIGTGLIILRWLITRFIAQQQEPKHA